MYKISPCTTSLFGCRNSNSDKSKSGLFTSPPYETLLNSRKCDAEFLSFLILVAHKDWALVAACAHFIAGVPAFHHIVALQVAGSSRTRAFSGADIDRSHFADRSGGGSDSGGSHTATTRGGSTASDWSGDWSGDWGSDRSGNGGSDRGSDNRSSDDGSSDWSGDDRSDRNDDGSGRCGNSKVRSSGSAAEIILGLVGTRSGAESGNLSAEAGLKAGRSRDNVEGLLCNEALLAGFHLIKGNTTVEGIDCNE